MITTRLSFMMFLQFFIWGAWFATLGQCLASNGLGDFAAGAYGSAPIAAMLAPLFLGIIADRFFSSQLVLGVLFLVGGGLMLGVNQMAVQNQGDTMVWLMIGYMLSFMPTLALSNTVVMTHLKSMDFPKVRVWGTIGWIAAGLTVGGLGWSAKLNMFPLAAGCTILLGLYCFTLPSTPPPAKGQALNWRALLMLDALSLLKKPSFAIFLISSCAICVPLAYYFGLSAQYLGNTGFTQPAATMTLGQMSEIVFMLLIPFFFRRLGVKGMLLIGMFAWVGRYALYSYGAADQTLWMLLAAIALHGICYDFFFVTGFMYADKVAPSALRGQTQSLLVFLTQGVGMYLGYKLAFGGGTSGFGHVADYGALNSAITAGRPEVELSFWQQLGQMFTFSIPESVDPSILSKAMTQWGTLWKFPMILALIVTVLFALTFRDRSEKEKTEDA